MLEILKKKKLFLSLTFSLAFLLLHSNGNALIIDDFTDKDVSGSDASLQTNIEGDGDFSWNSVKLSNVVGGCRKAEMKRDGKGTFESGRYSHNQGATKTARSTITWGECEDGITMPLVDLTIDGGEYIIVETEGSEHNGDIFLELHDDVGYNGRVNCSKVTDVHEYRCEFSKFLGVNLKKIEKIILEIDGRPGFDLDVTKVLTGNEANTVCGVIPSALNGYGAKDECEICPGETDYGLGKDECGYCPNDTLPKNYSYGDGKICKYSCDKNQVCGWCPTSTKHIKDGGYTCRQCDDGIDNDGDGKIDCKDPQCLKGVGGTCDRNYDSEAPQCSNLKDDDGDGLVDDDDPACMDENGDYDLNLDSEADDPACSDGIDNDGDKLKDDEDPGCYAKDPLSGKYVYKPYKRSEKGPDTECSDGIDNDGDGYIDSKDPDCWHPDSTKLGGTKDYSSVAPFYDWNPWHDSEAGDRVYECSDGIDNDLDGLIDAEDPGCLVNEEWDPREESEINSPNGKPECNDGIDNDGDGLIDYPADPGCINKDDDSEGDDLKKPECSDRIDNDGDGKIDKEDPACWTYDGNGNPVNYDPTIDDESGCAGVSSFGNLAVDNERLAAVGQNAALYLKRFHRNSSKEFKRTTQSANRVGEKIGKEINKVMTNLKNYSVSCKDGSQVMGTSCRNNNDAELNKFSKRVRKLNQLVRRAQRRGLFFRKNYEKKAISAKKQKRARYKEVKDLMLNNRRAGTRGKVFKEINRKVSIVKGLAICND